MTSLEALISAPPPNPLHGRLPQTACTATSPPPSRLHASASPPSSGLCVWSALRTPHTAVQEVWTPHCTQPAAPGPALLHCPPEPGQPARAHPLGPHMDAPTNC